MDVVVGLVVQAGVGGDRGEGDDGVALVAPSSSFGKEKRGGERGGVGISQKKRGNIVVRIAIDNRQQSEGDGANDGNNHNDKGKDGGEGAETWASPKW